MRGATRLFSSSSSRRPRSTAFTPQDPAAPPGLRSEPGVGKPVRVVSLCFKSASLETIAGIVDAEGRKGVDLVVLPEAWRGNGRRRDALGPDDHDDVADSPGSTTATSCARSTARPRGAGSIPPSSSIATGAVVAVYDKIYPYWNEFDMTPPALPGQEDVGVYDGRLRQDRLRDLLRREVPGGLPAPARQGRRARRLAERLLGLHGAAGVRAAAPLHIVTSTLTGDSIAYDITGALLRRTGSGTGDVTVARFTLDMDRTIYHYNFNLDKRDAAAARSTPPTCASTTDMPREEWFVLEADGPASRRASSGANTASRSSGPTRTAAASGSTRSAGFSFSQRYGGYPGQAPEPPRRGSRDAMSRAAASVSRRRCCRRSLCWPLAAQAHAGDEAIRLPTTDAHYGPVKDYVEAVPRAGLPARAARGGRGVQGHQVRGPHPLGPLLRRVRRRRVVAVPRPAVRRGSRSTSRRTRHGTRRASTPRSGCGCSRTTACACSRSRRSTTTASRCSTRRRGSRGG